MATDVALIDNTTKAYVGAAATVQALGDITVAAKALENVLAFAAGLTFGSRPLPQRRRLAAARVS